MHRKSAAATAASPAAAGHPFQHHEQQQYVGRVQNRIDRMIYARPSAKHLAIEHQRKPRKRIPIGRLERREGPADAGQRKAIAYVAVVGHVGRVVVVCELEADGLRA